MKNQHTAKQEKYHLILHFTSKSHTKYRTAWHNTAGPEGTLFFVHTHTNHSTVFPHNIEEKQQPVMQKSPCTTHPFTASISISERYSCALKALSACKRLKNYKDVFHCSLNVRGFKAESKGATWRGNASTRKDKEQNQRRYF